MSKKYLPTRETEDTDQGILSLRFNSKGSPIPASIDDPADNWPLETRNAEVVESGTNVRPAVSCQLVSLPTDTETPSFNPKTDCKKKKKLFKKPKNEFERGSVIHGTDNALMELMECHEQLTHGTHGVLLRNDMDPVGGQYKNDCHYIQLRFLGAGSFGSTYICKDTDSGKEFVKKEIRKDLFKSSEVVVPLMLNHENITKVVGLIQKEEDVKGCITMSLLMEYGGFALNVFMARHCDLQECHFFQLAKQGLRGLEYMHGFGMCHFDVKPDNLLVMNANNSLLMKLTDFGSSKLAQERISLSGWTPEYMAPESARFFLQQMTNQTLNVKESDVTGKADIFAMALAIQFMYCKAHVLVKIITRGETTYNHMGDKERQIKQKELLITLATDQTFVQNLIPDNCCLEMRFLLQVMTTYHPKQRYSAQEARAYIEEYQQKKEQRLCFKSVQATDHAVVNEKQVCTKEMVMQTSVPETVTTMPQANKGPVSKSTMQKLRKRLLPYTKPQLLVVPMTSCEELKKLNMHQTKESEQRIQYSFGGEHHDGRVVQSEDGFHAILHQPVRLISPQTVEIPDVSDQQPLTENQQNEMQSVIPTPSLFGGKVDFSVYDSGEGLFESNHQGLRQVTDDSSRSRSFDENEVP